MTIRRGTPEDLATPTVSVLISLAMYMPNPQRIAEFLSRIDFAATIVYLAETEMQPLGVLVATRKDAHTLEITSIATTESEREKGIGKSLIARLVAEHPNTIIEAETDDDAVDFYAAVGFEVHCLEPRYPEVNRYRCVLGGH